MGVVDRARAKATLVLMAKGNKITQEEIPTDIPDQWEVFPGTSDYWINIPFPESENTSACLYKAQKNSIFPPHFHLNSAEIITVKNPEGKVKIVTEDGIRIISYGESADFRKEEVHAVRFLEETTILVMWHPKMDGFELGIIKKE